MKLLFVIDNLGSGGAQRQMVNLGRGLKDRGHTVEFFAYYPADHYRHLLDQIGIPVHLNPKESRFSLTPLLALCRLVRKGGFDVVLSFLDTPNFYAELATLGCQNTRLVVSERFMYTSEKLPLVTSVLQSFHRLADVISVNSHHQRKRMENHFPWMTSKLKTIYNGFDLQAFSPDRIERPSRVNLNLIAIASVAYKKNTLNLVKAMAICRDKYGFIPVITWVGTPHIAGTGTMARDETDQLLGTLKLKEFWHWLGEKNNIAELILEHDALIHPSFYEGLPNVVCETLACGRPVLASNVCDHARLVEEGVTGFLFDPHDPEDIAQAINKFNRISHEKMVQMSLAARDFAEKYLSLERYVDEYENIFVALTNKALGGLSK